jgi:hypothetical protein
MTVSGMTAQIPLPAAAVNANAIGTKAERRRQLWIYPASYPHAKERNWNAGDAGAAAYYVPGCCSTGGASSSSTGDSGTGSLSCWN